MINRRSLVALSASGLAIAATGTRFAAAQSEITELPFQNASFIRDLSAAPISTPIATPGATPRATLELEDVRGYILGDADAPNTLQIYSDYRCPHCRMFHAEIQPSLIADFVETGVMNLELMDYTVIGVPSFDALTDDSIESVQAAEAAACAAEQNAYLDYREWLYAGELQTSDGDFSDDNLIDAADTLGLDVDQFSTALLDGVYEEGIIAMVTKGIESGVQGTPTMILNGGEPFFVPQNGYQGLKELIEADLN